MRICPLEVTIRLEISKMEPGAQLFGAPKNHWDVASKTNLSWLWTSGNIAVNTYLCIHMPIYVYIYILYTYFYITKFMACNLYCPPSLLDRLARQDLLALLAPVLGWNSGYTCSILKSDSQGEHKHQDPLVVKHGLLENSPAIVRWFSHWFPSHLWLRKGKPTATGGRGWWTDSQ